MEMRKQVLAVTIGVLLVLSFFSVLQFWQIKPAQATDYLNDGFESGTILTSDTPAGAWSGKDGGAQVIVQSAIKHHGTYGMTIQYTGAWQDYRATRSVSDLTTMFYRFYFQSTSFSITDGQSIGIAHWKDTHGGATEKESVEIGKTGTDLYIAITGVQGNGSYTYAFQINTWYCVEVEYVKDASVGEVRLWLDGTERITDTSLGTSWAVDQVHLGYSSIWGVGGAFNVTYDCAVISSSYIGTEELEVGNIGTSTSVAGASSTFYANWTVLSGSLDQYIFGTNNTGSWVNETSTAFTTTWSNITKTLNTTVGVRVEWEIWGNNTNNIWKNTGLQYLVTTSGAPSYDNIIIKGEEAGVATTITIRWTAITGTTLSHSIFSWNNTASWVNTTIALSGTPAWHNFTDTVNSSKPVTIAFKFYGNSSTGSTTTTSTMYFVTKNDSMTLYSEGKYLKDGNDNVVILKGANKPEFADDPDGIWMGSTSWTDANVKQELDAMSIWGINVIRCHLNIEDWKYDNSAPYASISCRDAIKRLLQFANERGIYVILDGYRVQNYWHNGSQDLLPYPPYQTMANSTTIIADEDEFLDWCVSFGTELNGYSNVIFEIWNEPTGDATAMASFFNVSQYIITAMRNVGFSQPIVFQWDASSWVNLSFPPAAYPPSVTGSVSRMDWVYDANLNDTLNNIIYSTHGYRVYNAFHYSVPSYTKCYNASDIALYTYYAMMDNVSASHPVLFGETGVNIGETGTELLHEEEAVRNLYAKFGLNNISYIQFQWRNIGQFATIDSNLIPNVGGIELIKAINPTPFVWTAGAATSIYSNTTAWSDTWSSDQLTVTYTGATQVRVFWNVSSTYPMNSLLYCYNSNGTYVLATDVYDATTNLIRLNSTATGIWTIGYTFPPGIEVITIVNTWWYGWW